MKLCGKKCHYMDMQLFGVLDITLTTLLNTENKQMCKKTKKKTKLFSICSLSARKTQYFIRPFHCVCVPGAAHSLGPCDLETG